MHRRLATPKLSVTKQSICADNVSIADSGAVACSTWLVYDKSDSLLEVTHDRLSRAGDGPFNSFYKGLVATTTMLDQHITEFGYSYRSLTIQAGKPVNDRCLI
ncbi:alpha/beta hydrolase [Mycobacterium leprae]|uniref:alpha/beta hydrolase n=1 Tax=Mycobacterium leprae TaxID=1769 RepID=UPI000AA380D3